MVEKPCSAKHVFSKLDANSRFWQIPLSQSSFFWCLLYIMHIWSTVTHTHTHISADACHTGSVQYYFNKWRGPGNPLHTNETECRYAQIEKEALATTWACEKFSTFIIGNDILIETNHNPLVPLLGIKHLDSLPPHVHVLQFRLHFDWFSYDIHHVPGNQSCRNWLNSVWCVLLTTSKLAPPHWNYTELPSQWTFLCHSTPILS